MGELVGGEGSGADGWMDGQRGRWVCGWYGGWMDRGVGGGLRGLMGVWIVVRVGGWNHLIHHFSSNRTCRLPHGALNTNLGATHLCWPGQLTNSLCLEQSCMGADLQLLPGSGLPESRVSLTLRGGALSSVVMK